MNEDRTPLLDLLLGLHVRLRPGVKPMGWADMLTKDSDLPTKTEGQITDYDHRSASVEVLGWWFDARDVERL